MTELYLSSDVETDGKIPGVNSMLSFATVVFDGSGNIVSEFTRNVRTLPGAVSDPPIMKWWEGQPHAWAAHRENAMDPSVAMHEYLAWLKSLTGKLVFVAYPASFDFMFIYWYLIRFTGECPFPFAALDMKSYAMALLKVRYTEVSRKTFPSEWLDPDEKHTHIALDDAREQGYMFTKMLRSNTQ